MRALAAMQAVGDRIDAPQFRRGTADDGDLRAARCRVFVERFLQSVGVGRALAIGGTSRRLLRPGREPPGPADDVVRHVEQ
jgi:hypothetical protein